MEPGGRVRHPATGVMSLADRALRAWPLLLLTTLPVLAEAAVLRGLHFTSAIGLAPQVSATATFGVFHDLRWLLVYHRTWWGFVLEFLAALVLRSALMAGIVHTAWPPDAPRPPLRATLRRSVVFTLAAMVFLSPWAVVAMAASETALSWFFLGELLPVLFLGAFLSKGGIAEGWWRGMPCWGAMGWTFVSFLMLCLDAMVVSFTPGWWQVPVAGAAGAVNAWLWHRTVHSVVHGSPRAPRLPTVPIAYVVSALSLVALGQFSIVGIELAGRPVPPIRAAHAPELGDKILFVAGFDSVYDPARTRGDPVIHYSYRGLRDGKPLPYGPEWTHESMLVAADKLAAQVRVAHERTGKPIALVGQSEGTLVVRTYLERHPADHVGDAVLLSPLVRPGRIYYPPPDRSSGWGYVAGWELRGMLAVVRITSGTKLSPDEPFLRSVLDHAPLFRNRMLCPVHGVRMVAFLPTISAAVVPPGAVSHIPTIELPGLHAALLGRQSVQERMQRFLMGQKAGNAPGLYYPVIQKASSAWQAPALALSLNPVWHAAGLPDTAFGDDGCVGRR